MQRRDHYKDKEIERERERERENEFERESKWEINRWKDSQIKLYWNKEELLEEWNQESHKN